ncbi:MAG: hypothetical protein N2259_03145 [Patescibacteria group bacterium]|nr:hypothetical protein [Patescibacteria group bacterium]
MKFFNFHIHQNSQSFIFKIFFLFSLLSLFLSIFSPVLAENTTSSTSMVTVYTCDTSGCRPGGLMKAVSLKCACCGDCDLNDILKIVVGISRLILRWVGVLALIFFIIGGIIWLTSSGNPEQVKRGKQILVGTLIGLCIVFFAWQIVNIIICGLSQGKLEESCTLFNRKWYVFPGEKEKKCQMEERPNAACFTNWPECPSFAAMGPNPIWNSDCKKEEVKTIQQKLAQLCCYGTGVATIDGCFGPETRNAVKLFCQKNSGCGTGNDQGYVDQTTYNLITTGTDLQLCQE